VASIPFGSLDKRVLYGVFDGPHYAYGVCFAADQAKRLGLNAVSATGFGVADDEDCWRSRESPAPVAKQIRSGVSPHPTQHLVEILSKSLYAVYLLLYFFPKRG